MRLLEQNVLGTVPGSRLLQADRAATLLSGSPPRGSGSVGVFPGEARRPVEDECDLAVAKRAKPGVRRRCGRERFWGQGRR
jgi:hypothetical protein